MVEDQEEGLGCWWCWGQSGEDGEDWREVFGGLRRFVILLLIIIIIIIILCSVLARACSLSVYSLGERHGGGFPLPDSILHPGRFFLGLWHGSSFYHRPGLFSHRGCHQEYRGRHHRYRGSIRNNVSQVRRRPAIGQATRRRTLVAWQGGALVLRQARHQW